MRSINIYADYVFQVRVRVPGSDGRLRDAAAGEVVGLRLRLSASPGGAAIAPALDGLVAQERPGDPALEYVIVDTALLQQYLGPLGIGTTVWAIWSLSGVADRLQAPYVITDGTRID